MEAAGKLNSRSMASIEERMIRAKCEQEWGMNYRMRNYCEERQLEAMRALGIRPSNTAEPSRSRTANAGPKVETLLKKTKTEVREAIGEPFEIAGARWSFTTADDERVKVYFDDDGKVKEVQPTDIAISAITKRKDAPKPAAEKTAPADPPAAVAKCGNGAYVYVSTGADTCKGYGGVAKWLKPQG